MLNKIAIIIVGMICVSAKADDLEKSKMLAELLSKNPPIETWTLSVVLAFESKRFDLKNSSTTLIKGFESWEECMKAGQKIATEINQAIYSVEKEVAEDWGPAEWGCSKGLESRR